VELIFPCCCREIIKKSDEIEGWSGEKEEGNQGIKRKKA